MAIIGDIKHSRVALSNIFALKKLGAEVMVYRPTTYSKVYSSSWRKVEHNLINALKWCDVANMLRIQLKGKRLSISHQLENNRQYD